MAFRVYGSHWRRLTQLKQSSLNRKVRWQGDTTQRLKAWASVSSQLRSYQRFERLTVAPPAGYYSVSAALTKVRSNGFIAHCYAGTPACKMFFAALMSCRGVNHIQGISTAYLVVLDFRCDVHKPNKVSSWLPNVPLSRMFYHVWHTSTGVSKQTHRKLYQRFYVPRGVSYLQG